MHEIRFCKINELPLLLDFIHSHWKKDHIFTKDTALLNWQHLDSVANRYNFVVAYNKDSDKFDAILGFIPTYQFDRNLENYNELWLAIWKVKDGAADKVSGIQLLFYLKTKLKPNLICSIGITENVKGIYSALKYQQGTLSQFFIKSADYYPYLSDIKTEDNSHKKKSASHSIKKLTFTSHQKEISHILSASNSLVHKSWEYIQNKFINHPTYKYQLFGIFLNESITAFFIIRKIAHENRSCLRIVDFYGEFPTTSLFDEFQQILKNESSEYIDFLCHLTDFSPLYTLGFSLKGENDIIPEYFEPFVKKNIAIDFAYYTKEENIRIFKSDSDQDRPSKYRGNNT